MLISSASNLVSPFSSIISAPILAHTLGVAERGELAGAIAPVLLFSSLAALGLPDALTHFVARFPAIGGHLFRRVRLLLAAAGVLAALAVISTSLLLSSGDRQLALLICIASLSLPPSLVIAGIRALAAGQHRWDLINAEKYIAAIGRLVLLLSLLITGHLDLMSGVLVMAFIPVVAGLAYVRLEVGSRDSSRTYGAPMAGIAFNYGLRAWIGSLSGIILSRIDQALILPLANAAQLGLYSVAVSVAEVTLLANVAIRDVLTAADAAENNDDRLLSAARISLAASALVGAVISFSVPFWLPVVFGAEFRGSLVPIWILAAAIVIGVPGSVAGVALTARGRPGSRSASLVAAATLNVALLLILTPNFGAIGAAWATLAGNFISANMNILFCQRYFGLKWKAFYFVRVTDLSLVMVNIRQLVFRQD